MPYLNITTSQTIADEDALLQAVSQTVSQATGKPEVYVMVAIEGKQAMSMSGSHEPAAFLDYRALGLPSDHTAFCDALCQLIVDQLDIAADRIYINMTDCERQNWGWNHRTF